MKKIIPFLLFLPLVVLSIYLGFTQFKNKTKNNNTTIIPVPTDSAQGTNIAPTSPPQVITTNTINLIVTSPISGTTTDSATYEVAGSAKPNVYIVINEQELVTGSDGGFTATISLDEGDNYISIVAYDDLGNIAEREILVTRNISDL